MSELLFFVAVALAAPIAIYVLFRLNLQFRVAILLAVMLSGSLSFVGIPGFFGLLVLIFVVRDADYIFKTWSTGKLWCCVLAMVLVVAIEPGAYSLSVSIGIAIAIYASTAIRNGGLIVLAWGGFIGSLIFALRNLTAPVITVADSINGDVSMIGRRILPNIDPNATAAILLLGILFGIAILIQERGFLTLIVVIGIVVMAVSIVLVAARYAMVAAVVSIMFAWLSSGSITRKGAIAAVALMGSAAALPFIGEAQSFARFAKVSNDTDSRTDLYATWWNLIYEQGLLLGLPAEVIDAQPTAPHNAALEALAHFGLVGFIALTFAAWFVILPFSAGGWQMRVPALGVLGLAMIVGLIALYTPWLALVLLNAQAFVAKGKIGPPAGGVGSKLELGIAGR